MPRDHDDAHYLHGRHGLSVLVRPPVEAASHLAWDGAGNLLVATQRGTLLRVHPAMGTSFVLEGCAQPTGLGVDGDRFVLVERDGTWGTYTIDGQKLISGDHPFAGYVTVQFREKKVLLTGRTQAEKQVLFYDSGRKVLRIQIPPKAVGFISSGHFGLAQSIPVGMEVIYLRDGGRFQGRETTNHVLYAFRDHIVGVHPEGARVWSLVEGESRDVYLPGTVCAALDWDGRMLALGTAEGQVALADLDDEASCATPVVVDAADVPIRALSFSRKGKYLASSADDLVIWTWS